MSSQHHSVKRMSERLFCVFLALLLVFHILFQNYVFYVSCYDVQVKAIRRADLLVKKHFLGSMCFLSPNYSFTTCGVPVVLAFITSFMEYTIKCKSGGLEHCILKPASI